MKLIFAILFLYTGANVCHTQIVQSSCTAHDSILEMYKEDAERLAIRRINESSSIYVDSVIIHEAVSDTILDALTAVYNATDLAARDTVVSMFDIHTNIQGFSMQGLVVVADSNQTWMQHLKQGNLSTGNSTLDDLINEFGLSIFNYHAFNNNFWYHQVILKSEINYNMMALSDLIEPVPGIYIVGPETYAGDGNDITATILPEYIELKYSVGWGDCLSGCEERRYWKFHVYYDCSVEFMGSYGNLLSVDENELSFGLKLYPNPAGESLTLQVELQKDSDLSYEILDLQGKVMLQRVSGSFALGNQQLVIPVSNLSKGMYICKIRINDKQVTRKFMKG